MEIQEIGARSAPSEILGVLNGFTAKNLRRLAREARLENQVLGVQEYTFQDPKIFPGNRLWLFAFPASGFLVFEG